MVHCTKDCTRTSGSIIFEIFNKHSSCYVGILKFINSSTQHWDKLSTIHSPNTLSPSSNWHIFQIIFHDINSTLSSSHKSPIFLRHLMYSSCALKIDMPKTPFQNFLNHQMLTITIELAFVNDLNVNIWIIIFHACIIWPILYSHWLTLVFELIAIIDQLPTFCVKMASLFNLPFNKIFKLDFPNSKQTRTTCPSTSSMPTLG